MGKETKSKATPKKRKPRKSVNTAARKSAAKKAAFLEAFARLGTVTHAAKAAGVSRSLPYTWAGEDEEFKAAWEEAQQQANDALEREARRRAIEGVEEPVIHQGQLTLIQDPETGEIRPLTVRKYSDTLLIFLLKGNNPAKFRENATVEVAGPGGGPIKTEAKVEVAPITADQIPKVLSVLVAAGVVPVGETNAEEGAEEK